jgi:non-specific protein-tyrosine kinase
MSMGLDTETEERSSLESVLEYAQILWHWAWLLILAAVLAGGVAYYITNQQQRVYQATTLVQVNAASGASIDTYTSLYLGQQLATTYTSTMLTRPVMDAVSERVGFAVAAYQVSVQTVSNTSLIKVTVSNEDPEKAALIANTLVAVFAEQVLTDQTSRYKDLKTSLETELSNLDYQIDLTQQKLSAVITKMESITSTDPSGEPILDPADVLAKSQYESIISQYQQSRAYIVQTYQQLKLAEAQATSSLIQKDPAIPNYVPVQPQPLKSGLLAAVVGFMLAAGVIFLIAFLQDEIRDPEEITRKWGVPILGLITSYKPNGNPIITVAQPRAPVSEAYRSVRTNLQFSGVDKPLRTILITSASPSDGKTSVVGNLSTVMAHNNKEVVVIDCDLRRPTIHKVFGLTNRLGLSDYFIRTTNQLAGVVKKSRTKGLSVITSGSLPPNPSELLNSSKMMEIINFLGTHFDTIILDTPPLLAVTDALVLAPRVDGVILVMDPTKTKRGALRHAIEQLSRVNANLLGVVLNNIKVKRSQYYYNRNYYYGKRYGKAANEPAENESQGEEVKSG